MMKQGTRLTASLLCALAISAGADTSHTNSLDHLRAVYDATAAQIAADARQQKDAALAQYGKSIEAARQRLKQEGDLDGYVAAEQEIKRFQAEKTLPPSSPHPLITEAIFACEKQTAAADAEAARRTSVLLRQYIAALSGLIKELMVQDKLDEAKTVAGVKHAAEFTLADLESKSAPDAIAGSVPEQPGAEPRRAGAPPYPADAKAFGGHHYALVMEPLTWNQARKACEKMGGHLVTIGTQEEDEAVKSLLSGPGNGKCRPWIGLTDEKKHGRFTWIDGTPFDYSGWAAGEPNNMGGVEHYGSIFANGKGWNDCSFKDPKVTGYICEWDR